MNNSDPPVLLITFNRPENTKLIIEKLYQARIEKLYIFNDGPRNGNIKDLESRKEISGLINSINWDCDLQLNFQDYNLGCGLGVATAISWAFKKEDYLIILEDDCIPSMPFFTFCKYCLEKYKHDTRIWMISGRSHHQNNHLFDNQDYIFSHYTHTWGWATWKRCWKEFDIHINDFDKFINQGGAINVLSSIRAGKLFNKIFKKVFSDKKLYTHAWDYQFDYLILKNGGLSIIPAKNLIKNIGLSGTHTSTRTYYYDMDAVEDFNVSKVPPFVIPNKEFEDLHFKIHIKKIFGKRNILIRILNRLFKIIPEHKRL